MNLMEGKEGYENQVTAKVKGDMENLMKEIGTDQTWSDRRRGFIPPTKLPSTGSTCADKFLVIRSTGSRC